MELEIFNNNKKHSSVILKEIEPGVFFTGTINGVYGIFYSVLDYDYHGTGTQAVLVKILKDNSRGYKENRVQFNESAVVYNFKVVNSVVLDYDE